MPPPLMLLSLPLQDWTVSSRKGGPPNLCENTNTVSSPFSAVGTTFWKWSIRKIINAWGDLESSCLDMWLTVSLVNTFVTECHSRKHWKNLFWLALGSNNKEFYWIYIFTFQGQVGFLWRIWVQHLISYNEFKAKTTVVILKVIKDDYHILTFFSWYKYYLTVLDLVSVLKKY